MPTLSTKLTSILGPSSLPSEVITTLSKTVIAYLAALPAPPARATGNLAPNFVQKWTAATAQALEKLEKKDWFPVLDLLRLGLARDLSRLAASADFVSFFPQLITRITSAETLDLADKPLVLTLVRLVSNALPAPSLAASLLSPSALEGVTRVVIRALLDQDKGVRSAGAGLAWSLVGRVWKSRESGEQFGGEEWEVEVASAVLEALGREVESVDVGESCSSFARHLLTCCRAQYTVSPRLSAYSFSTRLTMKRSTDSWRCLRSLMCSRGRSCWSSSSAARTSRRSRRCCRK